MTNRELQELLALQDDDKPVLFVRDPDADGPDDDVFEIMPFEISAVESFEDVVLLTRRINDEERAAQA